MLENDDIQELLREKLQSHEVTPSDAVWNNVSNSLANAAASSGAAASGTSLLLKVAAIVLGVSSIGVAAYFILNGNGGSPKKENQTILAPGAEGIDSKNFGESIAIDSVMETRVNPVSNNNTSISEEVNPSEPINSAATEGREMLNEAPENLPTRNEDNMSPIASILDTSSEDPITENTTLVPPSPATDGEPVNEPPVEIEEGIILENQDIQEEMEELQEPIEVEEDFVLPNIFTPNNDGINDYFEIQMSEKLDFQIIVIDPTNKVIFQSNVVDFRWDGTLPGGEPVPSGNYIYYLTAKTLNGEDFVKHSDLRIER